MATDGFLKIFGAPHQCRIPKKGPRGSRISKNFENLVEVWGWRKIPDIPQIWEFCREYGKINRVWFLRNSEVKFEEIL